MPKDSKGAFHSNIQRAMASDKGMKPPMPSHDGEPEEHEDGEHMQIHDHGDGSFHTVSKDGERAEHPHVGHMLMHIAHHHMPEAKHKHEMDDGMEKTSHTVEEDGEVQGPHSAGMEPEHQGMRGY